MKRMGIAQQEINATEVIIRTPEREIIIHRPQVSKVNMMGQETFQVVGAVEERPLVAEIQEEDIKTVIAQTSCSEDRAREALIRANGDIAAAILSLKQ